MVDQRRVQRRWTTFDTQKILLGWPAEEYGHEEGGPPWVHRENLLEYVGTHNFSLANQHALAKQAKSHSVNQLFQLFSFLV